MVEYSDYIWPWLIISISFYVLLSVIRLVVLQTTSKRWMQEDAIVQSIDYKRKHGSSLSGQKGKGYEIFIRYELLSTGASFQELTVYDHISRQFNNYNESFKLKVSHLNKGDKIKVFSNKSKK